MLFRRHVEFEMDAYSVCIDRWSGDDLLLYNVYVSNINIFDGLLVEIMCNPHRQRRSIQCPKHTKSLYTILHIRC